MISGWLDSVREGRVEDEQQRTNIETLRRFRIPLWPWERLGRAMLYDLEHDGYPTFRSFLRYTEGAAIAPASVFMHLCGIEMRDGGYVPPEFDIRRASRPLALFSYLVHILRDFQKDQLAGLNYFAGDLMLKHGVSTSDLRSAAGGDRVGDTVRGLATDYVRLANYYRIRSCAALDEVTPSMADRYRLSLSMIYELYLQILQRIDVESGSFTTGETNPTPEQIKERIEYTVAAFEATSR